MNEEIEDLKNAFEKHRRTKNKTLYPKNLWQRAVALTKTLSIPKAAKKIGISSSGLYRKVNELQEKKASLPAFTFVEASGVLCPKTQYNIEFTFPNRISCTLSLQGSVEDVIACIKGLS